MQYKVTRPSDEEIKEHKLEWGSFNDFPNEWRQIDDREFSRLTAINSVKAIESRQMYHKTPEGNNDLFKPYTSATLMFFPDNTGVAIVPAGYGRDERVTFYVFGCEHKFREVTPEEAKKRHMSISGRYVRGYICERCDFASVIDSGD